MGSHADTQAIRDTLLPLIDGGDPAALQSLDAGLEALPSAPDASELVPLGEILMRLVRASSKGFEQGLSEQASDPECAQQTLRFAHACEAACRLPLQRLSQIDSLESAQVLEAIARESLAIQPSLRSWVFCALAQVPRGMGARAMASLIRDFAQQDRDALNTLHWENVAEVINASGEAAAGLALMLAMDTQGLPNLQWALCWLLAAQSGNREFAMLWSSLRELILARVEEISAGMQAGLLREETHQNAEQAWAILLEALSFADASDARANAALEQALANPNPMIFAAATNAQVRRSCEITPAQIERIGADPNLRAFFVRACVDAGRGDLIPQAWRSSPEHN